MEMKSSRELWRNGLDNADFGMISERFAHMYLVGLFRFFV